MLLASRIAGEGAIRQKLAKNRVRILGGLSSRAYRAPAASGPASEWSTWGCGRGVQRARSNRRASRLSDVDTSVPPYGMLTPTTATATATADRAFFII